MDIGRAGGGVYAVAVITVNCADHSGRCVAPCVEKGDEAGEETSHVETGFVLVAQCVDSLEPCVIVDDNECVTAAAVKGGLEWTGDVHLSPRWARRVEFASAHDAHEGGVAWRRLRGASDLRSIRRLSPAAPQCSRRCMYTAASSAAIPWMCDVARDECMARARRAGDSAGSRRVTCHSKRPPRWLNGRRVR
eukprot:2852121-Pleurochrysis_carterae.AAC.4